MKIRVYKREYHQVISIYEPVEITLEMLTEAFPDKSEEELVEMLHNANLDQEALDNLIDELEYKYGLDWEKDYDDWISDRKGGYPVEHGIAE